MNSQSIEGLIEIAYEIMALTSEHHRKILSDTPGIVMALEEVKEYRTITEEMIISLSNLQDKALYEEGRTDRQVNEVRDYKRKKIMNDWYKILSDRRNYLISRL